MADNHGERLATVEARQNQTYEALKSIPARYVSVERFGPVEKVVYGLVGLILTVFLAALLKSVLVDG